MVEQEIAKVAAAKVASPVVTKTVATKAVAAGLTEEVLHEAVATKALAATGGAKVIAGAGAKTTTATSLPVDPTLVSNTVASGKGISLGLGLGPIGPLLLVGAIGLAGYVYYQYRNKILKATDETLDEGFYAERV